MKRKYMAAIILILALAGVWVIRPTNSSFGVGLNVGTWYGGQRTHWLHRFEVPANTEVLIRFVLPALICPRSSGIITARIQTDNLDVWDTVPTAKNPCVHEFLYSSRTATHIGVWVINHVEYYPLVYTITVVDTKKYSAADPPPLPTATPFYPVVIPAYPEPEPEATQEGADQ